MTQAQSEQKAKQIEQNKQMAHKLLTQLRSQLARTQVSSVQIA
jgi:hypothetical protein